MATVSLDSLSVGSTVSIKEDGTDKTYVVVHKGNPGTDRYDTSCDGVWLMRKYLWSDSKAWDSSNVNSYAISSIHKWLNNADDGFLSVFTSAVSSLIKQVKIPWQFGDDESSRVTNFTGDSGVSAKAFLLSSQEVGIHDGGDGYLLDYFTSGTSSSAKTKRVAYLESSPTINPCNWWTRSAYNTSSSSYGTGVYIVMDTGGSGGIPNANLSYYVRPTMILPSNAAVVDGVITGKKIGGASGLYVGVNGVARNVTNAYVGIPSVKLTNLVPALSGTTGWGAGTGTLTTGSLTKYSTNTLCLYGGSSNAEATAISTDKYSYVAGHKYYIRNEVYFTSGTTYKRTSCYWPIAEPNVWNSSSLGISFTDATWKMMAVISDRVAAGHTAGSDYLRFDFDNNKGGGYLHIAGIMLIDLTAAFGSGKEPSLSWCNENIPYFTGTKEIIYSGATSKARKIVKGYIGVNGVARLFMDNS